ncbi:hypothetical protein Q0Z83_040870 [Actinoplanes sichuanensis]|uniref:Lipoprotein n=1 Tax=Actinoplanes sichuanensis TaxID=512349 RepID=A0ABW4AR82_9ACTN|nr:hypothetical protein [Actinoplanes sichuanensis]BEL05896.1 hypothetical protein Q0Z83_040870 [Actinoplanes sichuanensis]
MPKKVIASLFTALVLLSAGCSADTESGSRVATLQTGPSTTAAPSDTAAAADRPVIPADATAAEIQAMARVWEDCLVDNGGPSYRGQATLMLQKGITMADVEANQKETFEACESKHPEAFEDNQKRADPAEFKDNMREWYQCAKDAGYDVRIENRDTNEFGLGKIGPLGDAGSEKMMQCKKEAFSG